MALTFGEKIKESRKAQKLTQKQLAKLIGAAHNSISDWENNKNKPDPDTIELLCGVLKITPNYLLASSEDAFSPKEKAIIRKYRFIAEHSPESADMIDMAIDKGYSIAKQISNQREHIDQLKQHIVSELVKQIPLPFYEGLASAGSGEYLFDDIPMDVIEVPDTPISRKADFIIGVNGDSMEPDFYDGEKVFVKKTANLKAGDIGIFLKGNDCYIKELGRDRLISRNKDYDDIWPDEEIRTVGKVIGKVEE